MLPTVDRERFFAEYRTRFGRLRPEQVAGLEFLLARFESDPHLASIDEVAYMLATVKHETADTFEPIDENGGAAYFNRRYGPQTKVGQRLGNTEAGDGALFHGRGYVQLTGRGNYFLLGTELGANLTGHPEHVKDPTIAYEVMSLGMREGLFTGKKLGDYVNAHKRDFKNARRVINGLDKADHIAALAEDFREILDEATQPAPRGSASDASGPGDSVGVEASAGSGADPVAAPPVVVETAGAVNVAAPAPTVPIEGGTKQDDPKPVTKPWSARIATALTGAGVTLGTVWQAISSHPSEAVIITLVVVGGVVGLAYVVRTIILDVARIKVNAASDKLNVV